MEFSQLSTRLVSLEISRPALSASPSLDLAGLAPDAVARVIQAKADGTFPRSSGGADLEALVALANEQGAT